MALPWSWSRCVRRTPVPEGHVPNVVGFCEECGIHVKICWRCKKRGVNMDHGLCCGCWNTFACAQPDDPLQDWVPSMICCSRCNHQKNIREFLGMENLPPRSVNEEIYEYRYVRACLCCPLSPKNVIRYPILLEKGFDWMPDWKRESFARRAYKEELEFSGNKKIALVLFASFFMYRPPPSKFKELRHFHKYLSRLETRTQEE